MSSKSGSGGCLKNLVLTALVIGIGVYLKNGGFDDLFSSQSSAGQDDSGIHFSDTDNSYILPELENIDVELRENVYLECVGGGYCEKFCGDVEINAIFVTDDGSKWDSAAEATVKSDMETEIARIKEAASSAGVSLNLSVRYHNAELIGQNINEGIVTNNWRDSAIRSAGIGDFLTAQMTLEESREVSSAPIVFIFNTSGRATASHHKSGVKATETLILYSNDISAIFHEMCHLYGARDFYYPADVESLAKKYLPESIMNDGETVDPLTAFIIGWTDTLSPSAESFLRETSHITNEYLDEKHETETYTGYVDSYEYSDGLYTGYLNNGWPDGQGTLKMNDGTYQSGTWDNGRFLNGECIIYYKNGAVFKGNKVNGEISGYGVYTYSDGTKEEGYYVNGKINGQCVIYFANGAVYNGNKVNGALNGYGEMKYSDGDIYKGNWVDGNRHGQGTLYYASGAVYSGNWLDNTANGYGAMTYANGNYYSGNWENGLPNGYGEMTYTNGDEYKGNWKDNSRHGHGTYRWASGSIKSGNWSNGEYVG